jgi:hypothetical protein
VAQRNAEVQTAMKQVTTFGKPLNNRLTQLEFHSAQPRYGMRGDEVARELRNLRKKLTWRPAAACAKSEDLGDVGTTEELLFAVGDGYDNTLRQRIEDSVRQFMVGMRRSCQTK